MRTGKKDVNARELRGPWCGARPLRRGGMRARSRRRPALVRGAPGVRHVALVSFRGRVLRAAIGGAGIAALKREGDGASPRARIGAVALLRTTTRRPLPSGPLPWRQTRPRDGWCDDPRSALYNGPLRLPAAVRHETLRRDDGLYDPVVLTDHNRRPRVRRRGSAVFVHVAREGLSPTAGCLAFPDADWRRGVVPLGDYLVGVDPRPCRNAKARR